MGEMRRGALRAMAIVGVVAVTLATTLTAAPAFAGLFPNKAPTAVATASPNPAHAGQVVHLFGTGSSDPETAPANLLYAWSFGDGSSAPASKTNFAIDHTYADAGVYTATLTVTDPEGLSGTSKVVIEVDDTAPIASATATPTTAKVAQQVQFDGSASRDAETATADLTYKWDFKDGTPTSSAMKPTHAYDSAGTYAVLLTVTDPQGASSTATVSVKVTNTAPVSSWTFAPAAPHAGQVVTFTSTSTDAETPNALTYDWDFGDGTEHGTTAVATHTYATNGYRTIKLKVTDPQGLTSTKSTPVSVTVNKAPVAVVTADRAKANVGQTVKFDGSGSNDEETPKDQLTYDWDFGDGSAHATTATTSHAFLAPGAYTVKLTVTDGYGLTDTATVAVAVGNQAPVANLVITPSPAYALQSVAFNGSTSTDAETPNQLTYSWTYETGGTPTAFSANAQATHVYATPGSRTVTLRVKDAEGSIATKTAVLVVNPNGKPTAAAVATPNPAHVGKSVSFTSAGSSDPDANPLTYLWTFPGGATATTATATQTFAAVGSYAVTLKVTDPYGVSDTTSVTVNVTNGAPVASAHATPNPAHVGKPVSFTSNGSGDPDGDTVTYLWTFPGGATATTATASQTFAAVGSYTATLKVTDQYGVSATDTVTVSVTNTAPVASAHATPNPAHVGRSASFTSTGSSDPDGDTLTYSWAFPGGTTASTATASYVFPAVGTHLVTLTVTDQYGATATSTVTVIVTNGAPVASAQATPNPAHLDKAVSFTSTGSSDPDGDLLTYSWAFPGGATATTAAASHKFTAIGSYPVTLTVTDQYGATTSTTITVKVENAAPVASAQATPNPARPGQVVSFTSTGSSDPDGDSLTYSWSFPGGASATTATASHTFPVTGSYPVTLTVTDQYGETATSTVTVKVENAAPVASAHATPGSTHAGQAVSFTSTGSADPDGDSLTYLWTFPGGTTATTATASHMFPAVGSFPVTLKVTDQYGLSDTDTVTVNVGNTAPVVVAGATPNPAHVGEVVSFSGAGTSDPEGDSLTYSWAFPGGATANTSTATQIFPAAGSYTATLTVTDQFGAKDSKQVAVVVTNDAPVAAFTNTSGLILAKQSVGFDGRGSKDTENGALTYAWNFGDGTTGAGATPKHAFATGGSFRVTLTTKDLQGKTGTAFRVINVARVVGCQTSSVTRTKQWRTTKSAKASGGSYCANSRGGKLGGTVKLRATGSQFGLTFGKSSTGGSAQVYIDGVLKGAVSFRTSGATKFGNRKVFTGLSAGTHKVKIKMVRGVAYVDDFLVFGK